MRAPLSFFDGGGWHWPFDEEPSGQAVNAAGDSVSRLYWLVGILLALLPVAIAALKLLAMI